ncbi:HpcH/HpaI aldolase family protein [Roseibium suaedae]|uniref:4-hydroxy-2-oxoheptanedioate aldolase n=1 Tax=Roseibium suaedae TaxID=735517 RepID=A0A1M7GAK4_9HYPH|nr:aldolase/citrate lyase family protein [Roseibium suaedae]SHM12967.1 4-hydroxy-2-oxoheptanedioate aldolase [Roseibium suaedae]
MTSLAQRLRSGDKIVTAWSGLAVPIVTELLARGGYEAVTLDMQHGQHDMASVREGLVSLTLAGAHRIVRVPVGDNAMASRALDVGAEAVIAPMINSRADAEAFAAAMKYPPVGARSWGPHRAAMLAGQTPPDYLAGANDSLLSFAMIETPEAIAALEDILSVPGIDGVFVGPSDLSLTLSHGAGLDPGGERTQSAAADIARRTLAAGKLAGIYCLEPEKVGEAVAMGYSLMAFGNDMSLIMDAAGGAVKSTRV